MLVAHRSPLPEDHAERVDELLERPGMTYEVRCGDTGARSALRANSAPRCLAGLLLLLLLIRTPPRPPTQNLHAFSPVAAILFRWVKAITALRKPGCWWDDRAERHPLALAVAESKLCAQLWAWERWCRREAPAAAERGRKSILASSAKHLRLDRCEKWSAALGSCQRARDAQAAGHAAKRKVPCSRVCARLRRYLVRANASLLGELSLGGGSTGGKQNTHIANAAFVGMLREGGASKGVVPMRF